MPLNPRSYRAIVPPVLGRNGEDLGSFFGEHLLQRHEGREMNRPSTEGSGLLFSYISVEFMVQLLPAFVC